MIALNIGLIADGKTIEHWPITLPDVPGSCGIRFRIAVKQTQRVNHLHPRGFGKTKNVVDRFMIRKRDVGTVHRAAAQAKVMKAAISKKGDDLSIGRREKVSRYATMAGQFCHRSETQAAEISRNRIARRIGDGQDHSGLSVRRASQKTGGADQT